MSGIDEVTPHISLEGGDEASDQLRNVADAAQEMAAKITEALASIEGAGDSIKHVTEEGRAAFEDMGTVAAEAFAKILDAASSGNFTGIVTKMFGEFAGAVTESITKLAEFIDQQAQEMETLANLASATGMATSEILGLREAFASVGISTNGFERSIGRLAITIANDWASIQQAVRTSADAQTGAMLHVQESTFAVAKSYNAMDEALDNSSRSAAHSALGIQSAALGLRQAINELSDFSLRSMQNSNSLEGATLNLQRAQLNLRKDQGYDTASAEKALKLSTDKLAVKEAEVKLQEAQNKSAREGLEMEELQLKVKKAKQELDDAEHKQIEESIKAADRLKEAQLGIQKAQLAAREASEKQHEGDLKDIPKIAQEIDQVVGGMRSWSDITNRTELSAQNMTKAIILAAGAGSKEAPSTMAVFKEMSQLFEKMGTDATASNAKLEIIQHTMGAGFRSGQASAAQIGAVMARSWAETEHFMEDMKKFGESINLTRAEEQLKAFNSSFAQLEGAVDIVKKSWSGLMAQMLTPLFDTVRKSIEETDGTLNKLVQSVGSVIDGTANMVKGFGELAGKIAGPAWTVFVDILSSILRAWGAMAEAIGHVSETLAGLMGLKMDAFWSGFTAILIGAAAASRGLATALAGVLLRLSVIPAAVGLVITAFGGLMRIVGAGLEHLPAWLGGGATENTAALIHAGEKVEAYGQTVLRTMAKLVGASDDMLDSAGKKREGHEGTNVGQNEIIKGIFGNSGELSKMLAEPAHDQQHAADDQKSAAQMQKDAATTHKTNAEEANKKVNAKDSSGTSQNDRNQDFFDREIKRMNPGQSSGHDSKAPEEQKEAAEGQKQAADGQKQSAGDFKTGVSALDSVLKSLVEGLASALVKIGAPGSAPGKADGGPIHGPGGPTSDTAGLFALSDGEYVMRSAAVSHYGPALFDAINSLSIGGFATGGPVGARAPSISVAAGTGGPQSVLNLSIDGNHFNGLRAPDAVASKLKSYAVGRQSSSAQKMPTWMR